MAGDESASSVSAFCELQAVETIGCSVPPRFLDLGDSGLAPLSWRDFVSACRLFLELDWAEKVERGMAPDGIVDDGQVDPAFAGPDIRNIRSPAKS